VRESAGTLLVGCLAGAVTVAVLARGTAGILYQVNPLDPAAYAIALAVVCSATIGTTWLVSRRAARISPLAALQEG
jgi:ABC-type antimicrobial peptide transport system permease subunit